MESATAGKIYGAFLLLLLLFEIISIFVHFYLSDPIMICALRRCVYTVESVVHGAFVLKLYASFALGLTVQFQGRVKAIDRSRANDEQKNQNQKTRTELN